MTGIKASEGPVPPIRRVYVRPTLVEKGDITELTKASNGNTGNDDGGGFPNFYS